MRYYSLISFSALKDQKSDTFVFVFNSITIVICILIIYNTIIIIIIILMIGNTIPIIVT